MASSIINKDSTIKIVEHSNILLSEQYQGRYYADIDLSRPDNNENYKLVAVTVWNTTQNIPATVQFIGHAEKYRIYSDASIYASIRATFALLKQ